MFQVVIDNGATFIHRDEDNVVMGFLVNHEGIKEIIQSLPISKYFVAPPKTNCEEITKKQAFMLYDLLLDGHKKLEEEILLVEGCDFMFHIVIDNGVTYIYRDEDNEIMGFWMNQESIKEIINSLPISKYFVAPPKKEVEEITEEQAFMLYNLMMDYRENHKEELNARIRERYKKFRIK